MELVVGGVLGAPRRGDLRDGEVDCVAAPVFGDEAIHERNLETLDPAARAAVAKAARSAGVGGDAAADAGGALSRVWRIELSGLGGGSLDFLKRYAGAGDCVAGVNFEAAEFLERQRPAALGDAAAGEAGASAGDGNGNAFGGGACEDRRYFSIVFRSGQLVGLASAPRGVFDGDRRFRHDQ